VPTACISAIRPYTELINPPRSLWTSFEMGVPLGIPGDIDFQKRVLLALLKLFEAPEGPVLIDYPEDASVLEDGDMPVLSCPVYYGKDEEPCEGIDPAHTAFLREITAMRSWYDMSVAKRNRTTVGVSGIGLDDIGNFLYSFTGGTMPENPREDVNLLTTFKLAVEDLRAYYFEGASSQPGRGNISNRALLDWFWEDTIAGEVLLKIRKVCMESPDESMRIMAERLIAPGDIVARQK